MTCVYEVRRVEQPVAEMFTGSGDHSEKGFNSTGLHQRVVMAVMVGRQGWTEGQGLHAENHDAFMVKSLDELKNGIM